jgi:hypothetical protein
MPEIKMRQKLEAEARGRSQKPEARSQKPEAETRGKSQRQELVIFLQK